MVLSAFTAQRGVSTTSVGHVADHNEITAQLQEVLDELLLYRQGRRNVIRNGDMGVAQRGDGPYTGNQMGIDGWRYIATGGTPAATRVAAPVGAGVGLNGAKSAQHVVIAGQSAAGDLVQLAQAIEDVRTLAGKEVTLSFVALAGSGTPKVGVEVSQVFGTGGSPSAQVNTAIQAVTISTTATRYTVTFTIPSIAGKVLGTNNDHYLALNLWLSAGSTNAARASSIGIQNATLDITDVQLEQGSGSPFERLPQAEQLAWCQRYYVRFAPVTSSYMFVGQCISTSGAWVPIRWPVRMRAAPTVTASNTGWNLMNNGGGDLGSTSVGQVGIADIDAGMLGVTVSPASLAAGNATVMRPSGSPGTIEASAEL